MSVPTEEELTAVLARNGVYLFPSQVRAILPGAAIMQSLIARVNAPLPREAEPSPTFDPVVDAQGQGR